MKKRSIKPEASTAKAEEGLCRALLSLDSVPAMRAFLRDLCTPSELEALTDRWRVVPYILKGLPYREIHERTAVSITTIGRVARFLSQGNGGYLAALSQIESARPAKVADPAKPARSKSAPAAKSRRNAPAARGAGA
ncbi:MAG TPA: YerC/YecD family TrpR-related protein [Dokdonella sp.]|uniref:YerC/YecD family TrpR-related protein n=1 Tax=Dokdonella sp. TaxID=2291710 RepID=UPI002D7EB4A7|nr:YerC/YecD family TrpR-related protein [Dokdonella sp.]HET9032631.1 YerC/YecD family TrpR-related protein [Dokdonella sp.]